MPWKFLDKARGYKGPTIWACYPHTTKWDAVLALVAGWRSGTPQLPLVKAQEFRGAQGILLRATGCFPVDPRGGCGTIDQVLVHWASRRNHSLVICPEGRIEAVSHWRTGFYILSLVTGAPVTYCWMDYRQRLTVREAPVWMTGVPSRDLEEAASLLREAHPLNPAKVSPIRFRDEWVIDDKRLAHQRRLWLHAPEISPGRTLLRS